MFGGSLKLLDKILGQILSWLLVLKVLRENLKVLGENVYYRYIL